MANVIGIDIGGTKTAIGIVDGSGAILAKSVIATDLTISPEEMVRRIYFNVKEMMVECNLTIDQFCGIGIGAPGPLESRSGIILNPPNLPNWRDVHIVEMIHTEFRLPTFLENDANAATLAEKWVGSAQDLDCFVYLTISTGIGAGFYESGKLIRGKSGNAGDIGHMVIDPSFGTCACGQKGCFEWIASGTSIARQGSHLLGKEVTTQEVFELYRKGHPKISEMIELVFEKIGVGCVSIINALDPEKIVIGGGVSNVGEPLFVAVQKYVKQYALNSSGTKTEIVPAGLEQDTGLIGAAAVAFNRVSVTSK